MFFYIGIGNLNNLSKNSLGIIYYIIVMVVVTSQKCRQMSHEGGVLARV